MKRCKVMKAHEVYINCTFPNGIIDGTRCFDYNKDRELIRFLKRIKRRNLIITDIRFVY